MPGLNDSRNEESPGAMPSEFMAAVTKFKHFSVNKVFKVVTIIILF